MIFKDEKPIPPSPTYALFLGTECLTLMDDVKRQTYPVNKVEEQRHTMLMRTHSVTDKYCCCENHSRVKYQDRVNYKATFLHVAYFALRTVIS